LIQSSADCPECEQEEELRRIRDARYYEYGISG
jgi:hypothetical protein